MIESFLVKSIVLRLKYSEIKFNGVYDWLLNDSRHITLGSPTKLKEKLQNADSHFQCLSKYIEIIDYYWIN